MREHLKGPLTTTPEKAGKLIEAMARERGEYFLADPELVEFAESIGRSA